MYIETRGFWFWRRYLLREHRNGKVIFASADQTTIRLALAVTRRRTLAHTAHQDRLWSGRA